MAKRMVEREQIKTPVHKTIERILFAFAKPQAVEKDNLGKAQGRIKEIMKRFDDEPDKSKRFVAEVEQRGQHVSTMSEWVKENKITPPSLETAKRKIDLARKLSSSHPDWLADLGGDPESPVAAEFIAEFTLLPKNLQEDPNVLFKWLARLAASETGDMEIVELLEIRKIKMRGLERLAHIRNTGTDKSFNLSDNQMRQYVTEQGMGGVVSEGWVLYDPAVDTPTGDLKEWLEDYNAKLESLDPDNSEAIRVLQNLRDKLSEGSRKKDIPHPTKPGQVSSKLLTVDKDDAKSYLERLKLKINELRGKEAIALEASRSILGHNIQTAEQLEDKVIEQMGTRYRVDAGEVKEAYDVLSTDDERKKFIAMVRRKIRKKLDTLENEHEKWEIRASIDDRIRELVAWKDMLSEIDPTERELIMHEVDARQWEHNLYVTLMKGASPTETRELLHEMQSYDTTEIHEAITRIPGVKKAFQLIDHYAHDLLKAEADPQEEAKIWKIITDQIDNMKICNTEESGITPEAAVRIARRHYKETGRDAMKYREYIRKNKLIQIVQRDGRSVWVVDPHTPLLWDPFRLLYCPEAMQAFFQFGSDMKGSMRDIRMPDGKIHKIAIGQGVGAEVAKVLYENGFDLNLQDFYSRRKDYILEAWIDEQVSEDQIGRLSGDARQRLQAEHDAWYAQVEKMRESVDPAVRLNADILGIQRDTIKLRRNVEFAQKYGTPVWAREYVGQTDGQTQQDILGQTDKIVKKIDELMRRAPGQAALLEQVKQEHLRAAQEAVRINSQMRATYGEYGDFIPSLEKLEIDEIPWGRIRRKHENVRGNFRDHFAGLEVYQQINDFINTPSVDNFMKLDPGKMKAYTYYYLAQEKFILPAYMALCDVQRGKGPMGFELLGFVDLFKSKYAKVYDVASMTDLDLYKVARWLVTKGHFSRDLLFHVRGRYMGLIYDKGLENADPISLFVLFMAVAESALKEFQKDIAKD